MTTVLVVEDEADIRELLRRYLQRAGLQVKTVATGAAALSELGRSHPDVMLLDLGLPDIDGSEVLAAAARHLPVVVLTARSAVPDRIAGLQHGAADYVVKPFSPTEVVLRVLSVLDRDHCCSDTQPPHSFGGDLLRIDEAAHEVYHNGRGVDLTPSEWALLVALTARPHRVLTRRELVERISGFAYEGYERAIDSHVKNLRRKLGDHDHSLVQTVIGFGYRFGLDRDG